MAKGGKLGSWELWTLCLELIWGYQIPLDAFHGMSPRRGRSLFGSHGGSLLLLLTCTSSCSVRLEIDRSATHRPRQSTRAPSRTESRGGISSKRTVFLERHREQAAPRGDFSVQETREGRDVDCQVGWTSGIGSKLKPSQIPEHRAALSGSVQSMSVCNSKSRHGVLKQKKTVPVVAGKQRIMQHHTKTHCSIGCYCDPVYFVPYPGTHFLLML